MPKNITQRDMVQASAELEFSGGPAGLRVRGAGFLAPATGAGVSMSSVLGDGPSAAEVEPAARPAAMAPLAPAAQARFRAMVDGHFNFVWRYLRGLGVPEANVDDAAQQVFLVAAGKLDAIEEGLERSFLVGTAHGVAANSRRASERRREVHGDPVLEVSPDHDPDPEEHAASREAVAILDDFLASLGEELRTVFILFELEGMTMLAIAATLGIPQGTVASRLRRAREEFHEMARRVRAGTNMRGKRS